MRASAAAIAQNDAHIEIRYVRPFVAFGAICFLGLTAAVGPIVLTQPSLDVRDVGSLLILFCFGSWLGLKVFDWRPVLTINEQSLYDRRWGTGPIPWSQIAKVRAIDQQDVLRVRAYGGYNYGVVLELKKPVVVPSLFGKRPKNWLFISLVHLDIEPIALVAHIRRFAPHLEIDTSEIARGDA
jgi:hypothetical protein